MPIKIKSTFKKQEFEYTSPDGDKWVIYYIENEGRRYVQLGKEPEDSTALPLDPAQQLSTWDVEMLLDIADQIREVSLTKNKAQQQKQKLRVPRVVDHRGQTGIDASVEDTMSNYDDTVQPLEALSTPKEDEWFGVRTGVDLRAAPPVEETPQEYKEMAQNPGWVSRKTVKGGKSVTIHGAIGKTFKRVGAADLI